MPGLPVFITASLALLVIPGPAVLYIVARSVEGGRRAGLVSVAGIHLGSLVHIAAAAAGMSAVLARSAAAYTVVKYAGAAYLVYLGVQRLRAARALATAVAPTPPAGLRRVFVQGVWVNVLNPKTALFFLAFLPQFVDIERGSAGLQVLVLGALFVALGLASDGAYALAAGALSERLRRSRGLVRAQQGISGGVLVGLGVLTAVAHTD